MTEMGADWFLELIQLAVLSVWFSDAGGVRFRPELSVIGDWIESWSALGLEATRVFSATGTEDVLGLSARRE